MLSRNRFHLREDPDDCAPGRFAVSDGAVHPELRAFLARADVPAAVVDASAAVVWANDAFRAVLGDAADLGRRIDPTPEADGGRGSPFRTQTRGATGTPLLMSWVTLPLGGPEVGSVVIGRDATDAETTAATSDARFRRLVEQIPAATYIDRLDGPTLYMSPQVEQITGYTSEEWIRDPSLWERRLLHPEERVRMLLKDEAAAAEGTGWADEYRIVTKDGTLRWVAEKAQVLTGADGVPELLQGVMFDVTEQREMLERLATAEQRYHQLIESIPAVVYLDADEAEPAIPMYISPRIERLLGYPMHDWDTIANLWTKLVHPEDRDRAIEESERAKAEGIALVTEYRMIALDGRTVWVHDEAIPVRAPDGTSYWQGFMLDVTARKEAEDQLARLVYRDRLTDLPNRVRFEEELGRALHRTRRSGDPLAVASIGLDLFRLVNESFGHEAGDVLLREVAERLAPAVRTTDLFARRGGDEFLVLLEDLDRDAPEAAALQATGRLQERLREPFRIGREEVFVSATVGIAVLDPDVPDAVALMKGADAARAQGKERGPGTVTVFHDEGAVVGTTPEERIRLAAKLRRAVEREEWVLHYQPVVDLRTRSIVGVEALVRWEDPEGGLIAPDAFVPLAETLGLIGALGRWVAAEVCRQVAAWAADGMPVRASFNLSPREFRQPDLAERILRQIRASGVAPTSITVEVPESAAMADATHTARVVDALRAGGLGLAVDGFGTGASSLTRLTELRPDLVKIDRAFVSRLPGTPHDQTLVRAMVTLTETLGLTAVAQGVETPDQERFLLEHGCTLAQGFLYSRPVPADQLAHLLAAAAGAPA